MRSTTPRANAGNIQPHAAPPFRNNSSSPASLNSSPSSTPSRSSSSPSSAPSSSPFSNSPTSSSLSSSSSSQHLPTSRPSSSGTSTMPQTYGGHLGVGGTRWASSASDSQLSQPSLSSSAPPALLPRTNAFSSSTPSPASSQQFQTEPSHLRPFPHGVRNGYPLSSSSSSANLSPSPRSASTSSHSTSSSSPLSATIVSSSSSPALHEQESLMSTTSSLDSPSFEAPDQPGPPTAYSRSAAKSRGSAREAGEELEERERSTSRGRAVVSSSSSPFHDRDHESDQEAATLLHKHRIPYSISSSKLGAREEDDEDPSSKKKRVSAYNVCFYALLCLLGLLLTVLVWSRWQRPSSFYSYSPSASSSSSSLHLVPLRPSKPAAHTLLSLPPQKPIVLDLDYWLSMWELIPKKLPFFPASNLWTSSSPLEELASISVNSQLPRDHPWYTPVPVEIPDLVALAIATSSSSVVLSYHPDCTPRSTRRVAVPGLDEALHLLTEFDPVPRNASSSSSSSLAASATGKAGESEVAGIKVVAGVKVDKSAYLIENIVEWSDEEKAELRAQFVKTSNNRNLGASMIWRPEDHTLKLDKDFPPRTKTASQYLFGDEYMIVILTEKKNHPLVRKSLSSWGQYVKHFILFSDHFDSKLNTTVLQNPLPASIPRDLKKSPWRVPGAISHLAKNQHLHRNFYLFFEEFSFPILDQLKWRFDQWLRLFSGQFPAFVAGRPDKKPAKLSYWPEHQDLVTKLFADPLQVIPKYAFGFDHSTLLQMQYYTPVEICPVLADDVLTLAALMICAGGVTVEQHFLQMTRSSHREKSIVGPQVEQFRLLDVYSGERSSGMVEEAFNWYYGGLAMQPPITGTHGNNFTHVQVHTKSGLK